MAVIELLLCLKKGMELRSIVQALTGSVLSLGLSWLKSCGAGKFVKVLYSESVYCCSKWIPRVDDSGQRFDAPN